MPDGDKSLKEKIKISASHWLAHSRMAGMIMLGVISIGGALWLGFYFAQFFPAADKTLPPSFAEIGENAQKELSENLGEQIRAYEQERARLKQETRDDMRAFFEKASKDINSLSRRLGVVERDLAMRPLPGAIASANDLAELKRDLKKSLDQIRQRVDRPSGSEFALLGLALSALKRAAKSGHAFETERIALKALLPGAKILDKIKPIAQTGAVPRLALAREFKKQAAHMRARGHDAESVLGHLWNYLFRIVRVRRLGEMTGSSAAAILSRMEARIAAGDLKSALAQAQGFKNNADPRAAVFYETLRPWLKQARQRLVLDDGLVRLDIIIGRHLAEIIRAENRAAPRKIKTP